MLDYILIAICVTLVVLPPEWDPAFRLSRWVRKR